MAYPLQELIEFTDKCRLSIRRAIHHYVRTYAKTSVVRKLCDFSYVLFTIISLRTVLCTWSPRWSYSIYRTPTSMGDWACSL